MRQEIYLIWDTASETFSDPFAAVNTKIAARKFHEAIKDHPYKQDFRLYRIGAYDSQPKTANELPIGFMLEEASEELMPVWADQDPPADPGIRELHRNLAEPINDKELT